MTYDPKVCVGQMWRDCDKRFPSRYFIVTEVGSTYAFARLCDRDGKILANRVSRIRIDRFRPGSTGYELVASSPNR
jgi:hypothetical protein